ncbi:sperm-associated antigen 1-like [Mercenaria mercenaria]|uniref:sperm-associated antigen 1-like n=1 Tax=Mercenaria mercenaria TaxID=6596 RepID=UPI00234F50AC|nr:sperm-associated antigen 1-like [Mercenaria mercenaria]
MDAARVFQGTTKKHDIPMDHLDFGYIKECTNVKHLEKILRVLRSKEEGFYPDLENCCESRLQDLNPSSRLLRKHDPLYSKGDLDRTEREELDHDLKNWSSDMKNIESNIGGQFDIMDSEDQELPPIRSGNITLTADGAKSSKSQKTNPNKKALPREYRDWDKIDVEKELEKVDEPDHKVKERTFIANREVTNIPNKIDAKGLSDSEKLLKANREKDKGNEAFRSNDFKEAITYYSRSISLQPTAASYNNRALAYLKTSDWQKAINDTDTVLKLEPGNVKALLRRGTAYKGLKKLQKAKADINDVLKIEPNNKKAQELLEQIEKDTQEKKKTGRRMVIEDVDGDEQTENLANTDSTPSQGDNSGLKSTKTDSIDKNGEKSVSESGDKKDENPVRRMQIEEVDSDSDKDDENEGEVLVNGHVSEEERNKTEISNGPVKDEQIVSDVGKESESKIKVETELEKVELVSEDNNSKESVKDSQSDKLSETTKNDTEDDRSSPVAAEEVKSDTESAEEEESSEVESSETEAVVPEQEIKRPVFYMKELPPKTAVIKEEATTLFKSGQYGEACLKYNKVISLLENDESQTVNLSLMFSNRAACHLKTGDLPGAVKDCNASLHLIPHCVKPLLRRALAYEHLERFRPAYIDYRHVLLLDSRMDQAHLGTKRCQHMLSQKDGPRWREKVHLPKVSPFEIPDIIGLDGKSTAPPVFSNPPAGSQSQSTCTSTSQSKESTNQSVSSPSKKAEIPTPVAVETKQEKKSVPQLKLTPKEQFETFKSEGNEYVKQSKFKEAIECYNKCETVLPGQVAIYTNRALCYIRTNQPKKAEEDCSEALKLEKDNVKALFRRAQARKMLKTYRDGIEDLKHLLQVDPRNSAAKKEMELLKNYWREELESMKKNIADLQSKKDDLASKVSSAQSGKQTGTHSGTQNGTQSAKKTGTQSGKQKRRMVIQEVESEEEENIDKGASKASSESKAGGKDAKPKVEVINTETNKKQSKSKPVKEHKDSKPVNSQTGSSKKGSKPSQKKSAIKETSQGLPSVPQTAPKLDKATPYEFISAWNALKNSETVKLYYDLLKQIKPGDIKTVISNKLDGAMLNVITRCVSEHYLPNGEGETSYELLRNLSTVPRFKTVSMFMSQKEKTDVQTVMNKLESLPSKIYSPEDIKQLRKEYSV